MVGIKFDSATTQLAEFSIEEAQDEINKWVSKRYDVSTFMTTTAFSTNPPLLITLCQRLARGYMWESLSRGSKDSLKRADNIIKRVLDNLKLIEENKSDILGEDGVKLTERDSPSLVLSNTDKFNSTFDEDDPLEWTVDPDKLDQIRSDRS